MLVRAKAPLRLGLAGGGTDVSPYSDTYGGCVLNAAIDLFAWCTVETLTEPVCEFVAKDMQKSASFDAAASYPLTGDCVLHKAVYNRIVRDFRKGAPLPLRMTTYSDAPPGSGLGSSSTMVVAMVTAMREALRLPLGEYDVARLAFEIERKDCGLSGGKQDQYAATFGGFNFMEFLAQEKVIINPLRIRDSIANELHARMLLYFTGVSRESAKIIDEQVKSAKADNSGSLDAMHQIKKLSYDMKERLLYADIDGVSNLFRDSWVAKKAMAKGISNGHIDQVAERALAAGAQSVKVSGAGGGGFMMIFVDPVRRLDVIRELQNDEGGYFLKFNFHPEGAQAWRVA